MWRIPLPLIIKARCPIPDLRNDQARFCRLSGWKTPKFNLEREVMAKNLRRVNFDGCLYRVVGETDSEHGACKMAEAYKMQTGAKDVGYSVDPSDSRKYIVTEKDTDQTISVKCNLCNCKFQLPINTAMKMSASHDGYIPCEKCGSHATQWDVNAVASVG